MRGRGFYLGRLPATKGEVFPMDAAHLRNILMPWDGPSARGRPGEGFPRMQRIRGIF